MLLSLCETILTVVQDLQINPIIVRQQGMTPVCNMQALTQLHSTQQLLLEEQTDAFAPTTNLVHCQLQLSCRMSQQQVY